MFGLALLCFFFFFFFYPFSILIILLGEEGAGLVLIVHVFVSYAHVNLCHFFTSSWCRELAAASACGSSWTFLFTFLKHYHNQCCIYVWLLAFYLQFRNRFCDYNFYKTVS